MQRLTQLLDRIKVLSRSMTATHRLLLVSIAVVLVMTLFVVHQYTATPTMVALLDASYPAEDQQAAAQYMDSKGIGYETSKTGVVMVPPSQRPRVLAQMAQDPGTLPSDKTILFNSLISKQDWSKSQEQNRQLETIALQNELASMLSQWDGIKSAKVIIDVPPSRAIGQPLRRPTAAVNVFSEGGLPQSKVDAIAAFVAGSRAGLSIDRVRIVDGTTGRQLRARSDDQLTATSTQELIAQIEARRQQQIADMLVYIPSVIVTVQAQVDATQRTTVTDATLPEGQGSQSLLATETTTNREESEPQRSAEPGVRANTGADISSQIAPVAATSSETQADTTFDTRFGTKKENVLDPRGFATKMNAVVSVPRSYFVSIWQDRQRRQAPDDAEAGKKDPTDAELQPVVDAEVVRITEDVRQMVDTSGNDGTVPGEVKVSMIPTIAGFGIEASSAGAGGFLGLGGSAGGVALPELVKTVALGGLAVVALGLVVVTAVKSSKRDKLPSASELVGIPPALGSDFGLVGEAEAADSALTGIELTEDVMQNRKIMEQVSSMIKDKPDAAATLVGRWIGDSR
jgi:flagellar biosynthesis/type III secretory pathway M-ring protein FliF/YscJ